MSKTKYYRDPKRAQQPAYVPYVPQYKVHGFEPMHMPQAAVPIEHQTPQQRKGSLATHVISRQPKARPVQVVRSNVPYANVPNEPTQIGPLPNTGNNIETSWASVDGEIIDDLSDEGMQMDDAHSMIDNNDDDPVNYRNIPSRVPNPQQHELIEDEDEDEDEDLEVVEPPENFLDINNNEYVLVVNGSILGIGKLEAIESEVRKLVFGDHELCKTHNLTQDDIIVLKRVKIKVGVFIE